MRAAIHVHGDDAAVALLDEFSDSWRARPPIRRQAIAFQERRNGTVGIKQITVLIGAEQITPAQRAEQGEGFLRCEKSAAQDSHLPFEHQIQVTHGGGVPGNLQQVVAVKSSIRSAIEFERVIHCAQSDRKPAANFSDGNGTRLAEFSAINCGAMLFTGDAQRSEDFKPLRIVGDFCFGERD